ncbi:nucleotidyltransferase family protein [Rhodanobacter sp. BL-MT-08]
MTELGDSAPVIVLLAAGESRRFGGIKQLADIDGETMVHRAARTALATGAELIVVTGAHAEQVSAALADLPLRLVRHAGWADGMGSSLAAGIRVVVDHFPQATGALLCLADQPLLETSCYTRMLERHQQQPGRILATKQNGVAGPPALFPQDCFAELMQWSGDRGAQALFGREPERVEIFAWPDIIDVDTPADLEHTRSRLATNRLE